MQAPKQEQFSLNWEIDSLTDKLQLFGSVYTVIDLKTTELLQRLIRTVEIFLCNKALIPSSTWGATDETIFQSYTFLRTIHCKRCEKSVGTSKRTLTKHLEEHNSSNSSTKNNVSEVLLKSLQLPKNGENHQKVSKSTESKQGSKPNSRKSRRRGKRSTNTETIQGSGSKNSSKPSSSSNNSIQQGTSKTVKSETKGSQDSTLKSTSENMQNGNTSTSKTKPTASKKQDIVIPSKEQNVSTAKEGVKPKRKKHRPNRSADVECLQVGCLPVYNLDLTNKVKKFVTGRRPKDWLDQRVARRSELTNSPAHDNIRNNLEKLLRSQYPTAKAYLFGSRITGLGNENSDLDVYLDLDDNYNGSRVYTKERYRHLVVLVETILKSSKQWSDLDPVVSARTPILRAWNDEERIDCDISFTNGLSHCNTMLILYFFELQPICYYVALYVKEWAKRVNIEGLNTYAVIMLTFYFFQEHNLLPSVYDLQKDCKKPLIIKRWRANFERKTLEELGIPLVSESATETYLVGFFSFYGSRFCFETHVVCPYLGWSPLKEDFDPKDNEIPIEMKHLRDYYAQLDVSEVNPIHHLLAYAKPMVVQDPFELIHNVAKGISPIDVNKFRRNCTLSAALLDENFTHIYKK